MQEATCALGHVFTSASHSQLTTLVANLPWITYRTGFPLLGDKTSDTQWGCMIRSGQMLLATACLTAANVMQHKAPLAELPKPTFTAYARILSMFLDTEDAPFSIHRIATRGAATGVPIGEWFGPSTIADALHSLAAVNSNSPVNTYLSPDGTLYEELIFKAFENDTRPLLLLIPTRLGVDALNPTYYDHIRTVFTFPHCVGISGYIQSFRL
jgi:cysteine protease ATG4